MNISQCKIGAKVTSIHNTPVYTITAINSDCTVNLQIDDLTYEHVSCDILNPIIEPDMSVYEIVNGIIQPQIIKLDNLSDQAIEQYCHNQQLDNACWISNDKFCSITHNDGCVVLVVV